MSLRHPVFIALLPWSRPKSLISRQKGLTYRQKSPMWGLIRSLPRLKRLISRQKGLTYRQTTKQIVYLLSVPPYLQLAVCLSTFCATLSAIGCMSIYFLLGSRSTNVLYEYLLSTQIDSHQKVSFVYLLSTVNRKSTKDPMKSNNVYLPVDRHMRLQERAPQNYMSLLQKSPIKETVLCIYLQIDIRDFCICKHVSIYKTNIYVCMYMYIQNKSICMYICVYTYMYIYVYTYIYMYT